MEKSDISVQHNLTEKVSLSSEIEAMKKFIAELPKKQHHLNAILLSFQSSCLSYFDFLHCSISKPSSQRCAGTMRVLAPISFEFFTVHFHKHRSSGIEAQDRLPAIRTQITLREAAAAAEGDECASSHLSSLRWPRCGPVAHMPSKFPSCSDSACQRQAAHQGPAACQRT